MLGGIAAGAGAAIAPLATLAMRVDDAFDTFAAAVAGTPRCRTIGAGVTAACVAVAVLAFVRHTPFPGLAERAGRAFATSTARAAVGARRIPFGVVATAAGVARSRIGVLP